MDQAKLVCTLYDQLIDWDVDSEGGLIRRSKVLIMSRQGNHIVDSPSADMTSRTHQVSKNLIIR